MCSIDTISWGMWNCEINIKAIKRLFNFFGLLLKKHFLDENLIYFCRWASSYVTGISYCLNWCLMCSVHEVKFFIGEFFKENQTKAIKSPIFCCTQQLFTNSKKLLWLIFIHSYHFDNNLKRMLKQWNVCIKKINTIKKRRLITFQVS